MNWYVRLGDDQKPMGPLNDSTVRQMISSGMINGLTKVTTDQWDAWRPVNQTVLARYLTGAQAPTALEQPPPHPVSVSPPAQLHWQTRAEVPPQRGGVQPTNHNQSFVWAVFNLFFPGATQMCIGQVGKGLMIFFFFWVFAYSLILTLLSPLIYLVAFVDGLVCIKRLRNGHSIRRWQWFP